MRSPFNDYDTTGHRVNSQGCSTTRTEDEAILTNLRHRWPEQLAKFSDATIINDYDAFALTNWFGDNDERFLEWMEQINA